MIKGSDDFVERKFSLYIPTLSKFMFIDNVLNQHIVYKLMDI